MRCGVAYAGAACGHEAMLAAAYPFARVALQMCTRELDENELKKRERPKKKEKHLLRAATADPGASIGSQLWRPACQWRVATRISVKGGWRPPTASRRKPS
uniref:Uncharacterized protein n=1 Tax=Plectus sambesii TaxID=2011161 RepID=A0A914X4I7_9BILA